MKCLYIPYSYLYVVYHPSCILKPEKIRRECYRVDDIQFVNQGYHINKVDGGIMKRKLLSFGFILVIGVVLLSGCSAVGIAKQDELAAANGRIDHLENQMAILSTINAYNVWYDQFYAKGAYRFDSVAIFNEKLGTMVLANGNSATLESWEKYLAADKALSELIVSLPEDTKTWDSEQYDIWYNTSTERYTVLGEMGTVLFKTIAQ